MKNLIFWKKLALMTCFVFILSSSLHAQPFGPAPWPIPPDTSHYQITNWVGQHMSARRPPDSTMVPATLVIRFRPGALDSGILSETYWTYFYGHNAKHKGGMQTLSGPGDPYGGTDEPRGFYPALRSLLFADRFGFDSSNNIVKDTLLRNFLIATGGKYLHRFTAASPLDTLTITTQGDTVPCDLPNWMTLSFDSDINPLFLGYLLVWEFPNDIAIAYPSYQGGQLYGQPSDLYYTLGYQRNIRMIEADTAWNYEVGDSSIVVEIADAGLDYRHPDFGDTVVGNGHKWEAVWNFGYTNLGVDSTPDHGTAMSGIIGAVSNNDIGMFAPFDSSVAGIAGGHGTLPPHTVSQGRGVTLAGYVANLGFGTNVWDASIFEASSKSPNTLFGLGVHVINCSEGLLGGTGSEPEDMHAALNYAFLNGVVFVAAVNDQLDSGVNPSDSGNAVYNNYPSDYEDPWVISVGGSWNQTDREKIPQSDFGYTLDLIAPSGASDPNPGTNPYVLNYTTRKLTPTSPFTYGPYGGTSAAAANVSGSAALLLSHYIRTSSSLSNIEPEDIQNILKASAWRGDTQRTIHPELAASWVPHSGYGHLDIGHAFKMLDSNITGSHDAGYKLYHGSVTAVPVLDTGAWSLFQNVQFSPPWQKDSGIDGIADSFAVRMNTYLPEIPNKGYNARFRILTFPILLPDSLENSDTCPLFAWGRSGGAGQPSGWNFSTVPNYETGWTMVTNGLGGDSLMEGIFAPANGVINLETVQWDVYGWNDSTNNYTNYWGHIPPDPQVAVNFSYFGRAKQASSYVQEGTITGSDSLNVTVNPSGTILANFFANSGLPNAKIEVLDVLGRVMAESTISYAKAGWNSTQFSSTNLPSGAYFCVVSGEDYLQVKNFLLVK